MGDLVNCPICLDMIEEAMETPCCHNVFCQKCIVHTDICPICRQGYSSDQLIPNIPMRRLLKEILDINFIRDKMLITCPNKGCETEVTKLNLEKHLTECIYSFVQWPFDYPYQKVFRKDLEEHKAGI